MATRSVLSGRPVIIRPSPSTRPSDPQWITQLLPAAQPLVCLGTQLSAWLVGGSTSQVGSLLYVAAYLAGGTGSAVTAWTALRRGRIDINVLMLAAAVGAATLGAWAEGSVLLFLFSLSNAMEFYALGRTRRAIRALVALRPVVAMVRRDGETLVVPVDTLRIGDIVMVKPAERLPADGVVVMGESSIDQASITGESIPVDVAHGSAVFAGTIKPARRSGGPCHQRSRGHHAGPHHRLGRGGPVGAGSGAAVDRPVRPGLCRRDHRRFGPGLRRPARPRYPRRHRALPGDHVARRRFSVRYRHLDAGRDPVGDRQRGPTGHPVQRRRVSGSAGRRRYGRILQDGDADDGTSDRHRHHAHGR